MLMNILTQEDLLKFKTQLFAELKTFITNHQGNPPKKWLHAYQVCNMLGITRGSLYHLYRSGQLPGTKLGGLTFFEQEDVQKLLLGKNPKR